MPSPRTFAALGLFVRDHFLSRDERRDLVEQMIVAPREAAGVAARRPGGRVDPHVRRAWEAELSAETTTAIDARVGALVGEFERHFQVRLNAPEPCSFLVYPPGAFYRPHRDRHETADAANTHARSVSVVVFVNGHHDAPAFTGGCLRFYGLLGDGPMADIGLDAEPEGGTLMAFPSTMLHEVATVVVGVRCSIVSWLTEAR